MKILHVVRSMNPDHGGPPEAIRRIVPLLEERGVNSHILCQDDPSAPWLSVPGARVHAIGRARGGYGYARELSQWLHVQVSRFAVVRIHGLWQYCGYATMRAARRAGVPYVVFSHGMLDPWFARAHPAKHLKKQLYWWWREYWVLARAARVLFTAAEEQRLAARTFFPYRVRGEVVPYGTTSPDLSLTDAAATFRETHGFTQREPLWLYLGRIHPKKGLDSLLRAWDRLWSESPNRPAARLVIAGPPGEPAYEGHLQKIAGIHWTEDAASGCSVVRLPALHGEMKWGALHTAQFFVLPSHQENFGMVVAEATAVETPVLLTNAVNTWREIFESEAGMVCADSESGVYSLLQRATRLSPERVATMRRNAGRCFAQHFDLTQSADQMRDLLQQVIQEIRR